LPKQTNYGVSIALPLLRSAEKQDSGKKRKTTAKPWSELVEKSSGAGAPFASPGEKLS
jgi:hypothetical protein